MFVLEGAPLVVGALIGWSVNRSGLTRRARGCVLVALGLAAGVGISALAGELASSVAYAVWDSAQAIAGAAVAAAALARLNPRSPKPR